MRLDGAGAVVKYLENIVRHYERKGDTVDVDAVFVALAERVVEMGDAGPLGVLADSMRVVLAAYDGEGWALETLRDSPAWQLTDDRRLP